MASSITHLIPVPAGLNPGIASARQATMLSLLGNPRTSYDSACREITNPTLKGLIELANVGPFRVQGLKPAVASLKQVFADIRTEVPEVFAGLGSAGMVCARLVRGSTHAISNHSWGTAIDLTLDGVLDTRGDDLVQEGLTRIAPIFNRHGWFWGAAFRTEDAMHFEVGESLVRKWHAAGMFGSTLVAAPESLLTLGDRGPEVLKLQQMLKRLGADVDEDGIFGTGTRAAVIAFQGQHGLRPDGVVGRDTITALGV